MKKEDQEKRLRETAKEVLCFLGFKNTVVEVNLVRSGVMKNLNRQFRGRNFTTNILSFKTPNIFPFHKGFPCLLGEIYLNPAYALEHNEDIEYLLIHGLLHLLDFDHERFDDRMKMNRLENKIIKWQRIKS